MDIIEHEARKTTPANSEVAASFHATPKPEVDIRQDQGRTDIANARRLVALHGGNIRYVAEWSK